MTQRPFQRRHSHTVFVGQVGIGGNNPIRIQSMTTSDTKNTDGVVKEIEDLVQAGCEIVRLTVPTKADCANLKNIRTALKQKNIRVPLVADIHFTPSVAMDVVEFVDKVRINPGNFVDKKLFKTLEYTDDQYQQELDRIEESFTPLVLKCKAHGVAMRVGTNHGSLSDRIMNRYGDTPEGMVESALEFLRIAAKNDFHDIILSMKASNTQVMVAAYRLLDQRMREEGMTHPFHLGVTEAGDGEDGRIKSAVGIGTLLEEGIGDTIRVSLTEDSIHEIPVAGMLAAPYNEKFYTKRFIRAQLPTAQNNNQVPPQDFALQYQRRSTRLTKIGGLPFGEKSVHAVWTTLNHAGEVESFLKAQNVDMKFEGVELTPRAYTDELAYDLHSKQFALSVISDNPHDFSSCQRADKLSLIINTGNLAAMSAFLETVSPDKHLEFCLNSTGNIGEMAHQVRHLKTILFAKDLTNISFSLQSDAASYDYRQLVKILDKQELPAPLHLRYQERDLPSLMDAPVQLGSLLIDGLGDSIQINNHDSFANHLSQSFTLLQACRVRISKTEFIACPSCGRTLFDLQEVTAKIRAQTSHLKGVKIAIMGCIVNGPGEMADADFGYVGTGTGKISLYVGKECVTRNIPEANALQSLIDLIKKHDQWIEPAA